MSPKLPNDPNEGQRLISSWERCALVLVLAIFGSVTLLDAGAWYDGFIPHSPDELRFLACRATILI